MWRNMFRTNPAYKIEYNLNLFESIFRLFSILFIQRLLVVINNSWLDKTSYIILEIVLIIKYTTAINIRSFFESKHQRIEINENKSLRRSPRKNNTIRFKFVYISVFNEWCNFVSRFLRIIMLKNWSHVFNFIISLSPPAMRGLYLNIQRSSCDK